MEKIKSKINDLEGFKELVVKRLGDFQPNFLGRHEEIMEEEKKGVRHFTSGVILPIHFSNNEEAPRFILTKRSKRVVQPGDLSFPGGHISMIDRLHGFFIAKGISPLARGRGFDAGWRSKKMGRKRGRGRGEKRIAANYLACALRETAEETGFPMRKIDYLGSLPPYGMMSFRRVIFPSVGAITGELKERLNWEVERIVSFNIEEMLNPKNYFWIDFDVPEDLKKASNREEWKFPALIIEDSVGREILWGATFYIILSFMWIVLNFTMPEIPQDKVIKKDIPENYFTGGFKKLLKAGFEREGKK
ncbi:MAG: NUDIX domain-containing protein [Deltaproteobacteria bacterium]|uniref:NUDIX domain-containing protein n=1 Tax=Candidatus Zymogenus saltonus TaxID=2844893 RepID=A0A9D8K8Q7_9DELT|nr:NUDIX domain-containing protein [Candidatus Zymogenus saltonus]